MKTFSELFQYTMYFDNLTNEIVFMESWDDNEVIFYDEFPDYSFIKLPLGYTLLDYLYLPFGKIISILDNMINDIYSFDYESVNFYLKELVDMHPYFGFYLLKFHSFLNQKDFDETDCYELLTIIKKDINCSISYCKNVIEPLLNECMNTSLPYEELYFRFIENSRINRYFKNREQLDYNLYYKTTFESIISYKEKPLDQYSFYKTCFAEYLKGNQKKIEKEYENEKAKFDNSEDIMEYYSYPCQTSINEEELEKGILPKNFFIQECFQEYINNNIVTLTEKYSGYISKHDFQFVESITVDEGIRVSICNCLFFELAIMLKQHCKITRCQNCEKLFPLSGDYNAKYCERTTNQLTCKVIANRKATQAKIRDIPAMKLYMKYYKRYKGRVRISKITESTFDLWNQKAKQIRDDCINEHISIGDFQEWLDNYEKAHM